MREEGSITVEASIVVTTAIFITFLIIFMAAFMQDYCRVISMCSECAWDTFGEAVQCHSGEGYIDWTDWGEKTVVSVITRDYSDIKEDMCEKLTEKCPKLWFGNTCEFDVGIDSGKIRICFEGTYYFPVRLGFFLDDGMGFKGEVTVDSTDTKEWIRLIAGVMRGFGGGLLWK